MVYQHCLIFGIRGLSTSSFAKSMTRTWNQLTMLRFIVTMHRKPGLVRLITSWTSLLQLRTSLVSRSNSLRKGLPLIWATFTWLPGLFRETGTMPFTMMQAVLQLKLGRQQSNLIQTSLPPVHTITPLIPLLAPIGVFPHQVFTKSTLMGQQQMMVAALALVSSSETTSEPLLEHSTNSSLPLSLKHLHYIKEFFAVEMGTSKAIFESNALVLIQALNSKESGGELGHILQDIKSLAHVFNWSSFKHLKREGNRAADELARVAKLSSQSHIWKRVFPPFIQHILNDDLM